MNVVVNREPCYVPAPRSVSLRSVGQGGPFSALSPIVVTCYVSINTNVTHITTVR